MLEYIVNDGFGIFLLMSTMLLGMGLFSNGKPNSTGETQRSRAVFLTLFASFLFMLAGRSIAFLRESDQYNAIAAGLLAIAWISLGLAAARRSFALLSETHRKTRLAFWIALLFSFTSMLWVLSPQTAAGLVQ